MLEMMSFLIIHHCSYGFCIVLPVLQGPFHSSAHGITIVLPQKACKVVQTPFFQPVCQDCRPLLSDFKAQSCTKSFLRPYLTRYFWIRLDKSAPGSLFVQLLLYYLPLLPLKQIKILKNSVKLRKFSRFCRGSPVKPPALPGSSCQTSCVIGSCVTGAY